MSDAIRWESLAADVRRAATPRGRERLGCFVIEGIRLHERALRSGAALQSVLLGENLASDTSERVVRFVANLRSAGCAIGLAPAAVIDELMDGRGGGAVVGLARIAESPSLAEVITAACRPVLALAACDVEVLHPHGIARRAGFGGPP